MTLKNRLAQMQETPKTLHGIITQPSKDHSLEIRGKNQEKFVKQNERLLITYKKELAYWNGQYEQVKILADEAFRKLDNYWLANAIIKKHKSKEGAEVREFNWRNYPQDKIDLLNDYNGIADRLDWINKKKQRFIDVIDELSKKKIESKAEYQFESKRRVNVSPVYDVFIQK